MNAVEHAQQIVDLKLAEMQKEHEARIAELNKEFNIEERLAALLNIPRGN